ncbi:YbhB/YbcL family Raf kinase inhibitor-like protein [Kordiimonas lipolytica]|uniref:YbhB/YbcL family Raf kinase inhibitor-like protein n=1 Tax=Kordiimonas lipolytica TaxID=1662421 RepID=A0ABV8U6L1_9PROT|nr:YbhB/YbcL family Raf kinase inhibitor-like protein [Kordiimonas lipolytica]
MSLSLTSSAFEDKGRIPVNYTCEGDNCSPALRWRGAPEEAESFLLTCEDPDAPSGVFRHWAAYDIPPTWAGLKTGYTNTTDEQSFRQAINDFGLAGYSGPCPPLRNAPHRYRFQISALDVHTLPVRHGATCAEVLAAAKPHVIESAELMGYYGRE